MTDLRYAIRTLLNSPGFTTAAVLTLALGIGANTAIFQLIDAVALRPLPIPNPDELVEVRIVGGNRGFGLNPDVYGGMTRPAWQELRDHQQALTGMFAWSTRQIRVGERSDLRTARGIAVSGEFFASLGVQPYRGRLIQPADEATSCPAKVAVVSHDYWQRQMGGGELSPEYASPSRPRARRCRRRDSARIFRRGCRRFVRHCTTAVSTECASPRCFRCGRYGTAAPWMDRGPCLGALERA